MDYVEQLLQEHSRPNTNLIAKAIGNNPAEFKKIIELIYKAKAPIPHRASWLLSAVNEQHPELLRTYLSKFVDTIERFQVDGVKRNMINVLASHQIPEKIQGKAVDVCFRLLLSPSETVVVKTQAMQVLANISEEYPELKQELKIAIDDQWDKNTAAFHARAKHIRKKLKL
ncbi:MAG TPA: hypothetical protein PLL00_15375 [Bacteroidia bacterium]|jgi:hypothetical protein|nr:hypothetical protein [Bacteroidia bacterium]